MASREAFLFRAILAICLIASAQGQQCSSVGVQCNSCNVVLCAVLDQPPILITDCLELGQHCVEDGAKAQCAPGICSDPNAPHPFTCTSPGAFPSAYKCDVAYFCTTTGSTPIMECTCAKGEIYDANAGKCATGECMRDPASCTSPGEVGELAETDYCYACDANLDALVFECGGSGNATDGFVDYTGMGDKAWTCGNYTGPPPGLNSTSTTSTTPSNPTIVCTIPGQRFADPNNCNGYFECDNSLQPQPRICSSGHYDPNRFGCVAGPC